SLSMSAIASPPPQPKSVDAFPGTGLSLVRVTLPLRSTRITFPSPLSATTSTEPSPSTSPIAVELPAKPLLVPLGLSSDQISWPVAPSSIRSTPLWHEVGVLPSHWQHVPTPLASFALPLTKTTLGESSSSTLPSQ